MTNINKKRLFMTTLLSGAVMGFAAAPTIAQDAAEDEIVVTGSRIKKADFTANAPVATVEAAQFERTGAVNTENLLNTLPQTVPGLDRTSNNPGNGSATVNLRGLGANRTLVLVNGTRQVPFGQNGVVDLNTIPASLLQNVEVLTGGASSVYGSDAVAGVVNFIYKDDFEGVETNVGYQMTEMGDAGLFNADMTLGANLDGGRGNVAFNVSYANRDALFQGERDFSSIALFNDGNGGLEPGGSSGVPGTSIFSQFDYGFDVGAAAYAQNPDDATFDPNIGFGVFDANGTLNPFTLSGQVNDFYNYAPVNFLQLPQERFATTAIGRYEINEHAEAYGRASFSTNKVDSQLAPTPIFQTTTFSLDGNPFIDPASQRIISDSIGQGVDTDGDGIDDTARALLRRRLVEVGPRQTKDDNQAFQITLGLRGETGIANWDYDVYLQEGRTLRSQSQLGNVNRDRFASALLLADADADGNVDLDAAGNASCAADSGGSTVACSPLNVFGAGNISEDSAAYLRTAVAARATYEQTVLAANFTGDLGDFTITGDAIGAAFGVEYIENEASFDPSQDLAAGTIAGFNGSPRSGGGFDVYSVYGELAVPVLADLPFAQSVTLDLAGRLSEYSTSGNANTFKIGGDWTVNDQVRFRGNYNTAVRAPNISELFSPPSQNFPGAQDPCSANRGPVDATTRALCVALGVPNSAVDTAGINSVSGQVESLDSGNPNLTTENAKTFTIGAVLTPDFIPGLTASIDYYDITIEDAIVTLPAQSAIDLCFDPNVGGVGSTFCNAITRFAGGDIDVLSRPTSNAGEINNRGVDIAANYGFDTADLFGTSFGDLDFAYLGTVNLQNDLQPTTLVDDVITCAGEFGTECGTPDPEYRHRLTAILNRDAVSFQTVWRLVGEVEDDDPGTENTVESIDMTHYFDSSLTWDVSDNLGLTFGINNVFNQEPPVIGDNDEQANTYPAQYDVFGRTFFANAKVKF